MLRALFDALESSLGPQLEGPGRWLWLLGAASVALVLLAPLVRAMLDGRLVRSGLQLSWTKHCARCGARTVVTSGTCEKCGAGLPLPFGVRLLAGAPPGPRKNPVARWAPALVGTVGFGAASFLLVTSAQLLTPSGRVERAFAGAALLTWAGVGLLLGRALSLRGLRPFDRLRAVLFAAAAMVALVASTALAQAARPVSTTPLVNVEAEAGAVVVNGQRLATEDHELSVEYQLLELPAAGVADLTPLSVGAKGGKVPLSHGKAEDWLVGAVWSHVPALQAHGVEVRRRTEQFKVAPGMRYQLRATPREVSLVPAK